MGKPLPSINEEPRRVGSGAVGFGADAVPGMRTAPVEHVVRAKTREAMAKNPEIWKNYNDLARNMMIVNRAQKGPLKDKPFAHKFNGEVWPEGADEHEEDSWLLPGQYMIVPKEVAWHICGNIWDPNLPDKMAVIQRYGDWEYDAAPGTGAMARMVRIGPPPLPDLMIVELDGRGKPKGEWKSLYELYMKGEKGVKDMTVTESDLATATPETWERVTA